MSTVNWAFLTSLAHNDGARRSSFQRTIFLHLFKRSNRIETLRFFGIDEVRTNHRSTTMEIRRVLDQRWKMAPTEMMQQCNKRMERLAAKRYLLSNLPIAGAVLSKQTNCIFVA